MVSLTPFVLIRQWIVLAGPSIFLDNVIEFDQFASHHMNIPTVAHNLNLNLNPNPNPKTRELTEILKLVCFSHSRNQYNQEEQ
jgi:hypothetical protein